jgi:hypothetical protein
MLKQIKSNRFWLGGMEYVDVTVTGDAAVGQIIHQPRADAVSTRWYCVIAGLEVGVFTSWYVYPIHLSFRVTLTPF